MTKSTGNIRLHKRSGQQGFSLLELLIALAVTVVGLAGLMSLHVATMKGNRTAAHTADATTIAQQTMEELRSMSMAEITTRHGPLPITGVNNMDTVDGRAGMTFTRDLSVREMSGFLVMMRIVVNWTEDGSDPATVDEQYRHKVALELIRTSLEAP
ncbi:MAG: prepilin-type N-terminal cleavage/methylation domain-containing protein [Proteobacteria bacterium]|nr:prepilin-type N-terminal cleavage/methylation domain-containing protein [Pseudomonadota bacterium]